MKAFDLTGKSFGNLTALYRSGTSVNGHALWMCQCKCGELKSIDSSQLVSGKTKSCGCLKSKNHNLTSRNNIKEHNVRIYNIWRGMKKRCYLDTDKDYKNYGMRGIQICDEWRNNFLSFYSWAVSNGYRNNLTIDRINYDGNYEPSNCRWIERSLQNRNQRRNIFLTHN